MPAYDAARFDPPAPLALVSVRSPTSRELIADVPLLIDSGADVTLLPAPVVGPLIEPSESAAQYELIGFDGSRSSARATRLDLLFLGKEFRGQFLLIEQDWGVMGRNILNSLSLLLDGPNSNWEEHG